MVSKDVKEKSKVSKEDWREFTKTVWHIANVTDPEHPGNLLRPLQVRWNSSTRLYYDLGKVTEDNVAAQVPGIILSGNFRELFTRAVTLQGAMGETG